MRLINIYPATEYLILENWTIVKLNKNTSYIIGINKYFGKIKTNIILNYNYIHNDFILISTETSKYKLYLEEQFKPTYTEKKLYDWRFVHDNRFKYGHSKALLHKNQNFYISARKHKYSDKIWETTLIVRKYKEGKNLIVYTESGSIYILPLKYRAQKNKIFKIPIKNTFNWSKINKDPNIKFDSLQDLKLNFEKIKTEPIFNCCVDDNVSSDINESLIHPKPFVKPLLSELPQSDLNLLNPSYIERKKTNVSFGFSNEKNNNSYFENDLFKFFCKEDINRLNHLV